MSVLSFTVHIRVNVFDEQALYRHARASLECNGFLEEDIHKLIGPSEHAMQLEGCVISSFNPNTSPDGTEIMGASVEQIHGR